MQSHDSENNTVEIYCYVLYYLNNVNNFVFWFFEKILSDEFFIKNTLLCAHTKNLYGIYCKLYVFVNLMCWFTNKNPPDKQCGKCVCVIVIRVAWVKYVESLGDWQFILRWSQPNMSNYVSTIPCRLSSELLAFASALLRHCLFPHYDGRVYQLGTYNWWRRSCDVTKNIVKAIVSLKNCL